MTPYVEAWIAGLAAKGYSEEDREFIRDYYISPCQPVPDKKWEYLTDTEQYILLASDRLGGRLEDDGLIRWDNDQNLVLALPGMAPLDEVEWLAAVENHDDYNVDDIGVIIRHLLGDFGGKYPDHDAVNLMLSRLEVDGYLEWDRTRSKYELVIPQDSVMVPNG